VLLFFFLFQRKLIYYPTKELEASPENAGMKYEDVWLESAPHLYIHGWYVSSVKPQSTTVLIFHGNGGNISHSLHILQIINSMNFNTLLVDYRGYGKSNGSPSENGLQQDAFAAWNFLISNRKTRPDQIVIFGHSLGGAVAAFLASKVKPAGLIIEGTFTSLPEIASLLYPYLPVRLLCIEKYNTQRYIQELLCPILIAHSKDDEMIPFKMGLELFQKARESKFFAELSGSHNDGECVSSTSYHKALLEFIELCCKMPTK
jgi:fermentation-respiration switch protein FrsA (DUF1100 family)